MAEGDVISLNAALAGLAPVSTTADWGVQSWTELTSGLGSDIYIIGVSLGTTQVPSVDVTVQILFELGKGLGGAETVFAQMPFSFRCDTAVGYYQLRSCQQWFPEPILVSAGTRIALRMYDSHTSAVTYAGVKIWYKEGLSLGGFDPFGSMGFFGI
jgi:hypothetical protein